MQKVSVVIPTWNEEGNIIKLIERIDAALSAGKIGYEIIFIDDHSTDNTCTIIKQQIKNNPISLYLKQGKRGKAQSLIEGFAHAKNELICMIDADLQYPPEAIPSMIDQIQKGADFVVANRKTKQTNFVRTFISTTYCFLFNKLLHGFDFDVQSGLKVFKKEIISGSSISAGNWAIDLELLIHAKNTGYHIAGHNIIFAKRHAGGTKINLIKASYEIGYNSVRLKFMTHKTTKSHKNTKPALA